MKKRFISIAIAATLVMGLSGCSSSVSQSTNTPDGTSPSNSETAANLWEYSITDKDTYSTKFVAYQKDPDVNYSNSSGDNLIGSASFSVISTNVVGNSVSVSISILDKNGIDGILDSHSSDSFTFTVKMTDTNGKLEILKGTSFKDLSVVTISKANGSRKVIDALHQSGTLSFVLVDDTYPNSTYSFSIDTSNFAEEYSKSGISF